MAKRIPSSLMNDIRANAATLATCIEISRQDRTVYRLTNHDAEIVIAGNTYRHDLPFNLSAISSGSSLSVDNVDLSLFCDGEVFKLEEFKRGAFDKADVRIFLVDWKSPEHGTVILRSGWFGEIELNENKVANITVVGLLKVFDFEVGRVYQPSCDADLGDNRCKVAMDLSQAFDVSNPYKVGEWVYVYDPSLMHEVPLVNPDFQADGPRSPTQSITGWTKSPNSAFMVDSSNGTFSAYSGLSLFGTTDPSESRLEQYVYQDVDLVGIGIDPEHIDAGRINFVFRAKLAQTVYLLDPIRLYAEALDENGNVIDFQDSGYLELDTFNAWRGRVLGFSVVTGARKLRLYLYMLKKDGENVNGAFDQVRAYWYDQTAGSPYNNVIHRVVRIVAALDERFLKYPKNASFEVNGAVANSNTANISSWTRDSSEDWWRVAGSIDGQVTRTDGAYMLVGGDDESGEQRTYAIRQTLDLTGPSGLGLDPDRILSGGYIGKFRITAGFADTKSAVSILLEFLDQSNSLVQPVLVSDFATRSDAPIRETFEHHFVVPALAKKVKISLFARSPEDSSNAKVGFDDLRFYFVDATRPERNDPFAGFAVPGVTFSTNPGEYTWAGSLIFKAHSAHLQYDVVSAVVDRKSFHGTNIAGADGTYETALIRWISGANAGQRNIIRTWDSGTKGIKLYFPVISPIQPGDRFEYMRACQKRFTEDCKLIFDNAINFRGFPYLPGKLT